MSAGAVILMLATWLGVTALTVFCFARILKHKDRSP